MPLWTVTYNNDKIRLFRKDAGGFKADSVERGASDQDCKNVMNTGDRHRQRGSPFLSRMWSEKTVATSSAVVVELNVVG
jgi:hypothetical protein